MSIFTPAGIDSFGGFMDAACHLTPIQGKKKSFGNALVVYVTGFSCFFSTQCGS